ncbi:MAG: hypothetical protein WBA74_16755 [Cyclobacteriaceae bacterium]
MFKDTPQVVREWLLNDDIEMLSYKLSDALLKAGYNIIETYTTSWDNNCSVSWVLDEGMAFVRSTGSNQKLFFEMSSFNHKMHLKFVIILKSLVLNTSGNS